VNFHKNEDRDAKAIAEAATRRTMSFVAVESGDQLDLQALHQVPQRQHHTQAVLIKRFQTQ